jgi:Predicted pPIWI-associating nuclease
MNTMVESNHDNRRALIAEAVRNFEVTESEAWQQLSLLSTNTKIDSVEVFNEEITFKDSRFTGPLLWHVTLQYGDGEDEFTSSDSFPGVFEGTIQGQHAEVHKLTADTSSFYD